MKLLSDENFDGRILRALFRRLPNSDVVRAIDIGLAGADDPTILEFAANEGRLVLTHDVSTMVGFAYDRISAGLPMPGLVEIPNSAPIRPSIDDLILLISASDPGEWDNQVVYLPF